MPWRKWLVRTLVFSIMAACASVALLYQRWTNPAAVRDQVIGKLQAIYPGAVVSVDSARMRILGGISVNELHVCRRDDPNKEELLHVPTAILYHDKEKMLDGQMVLRKVELFRPRLRIERELDGKWNLEGLVGKTQPNLPQPTVVIHQGTIVIEDKLDTSHGPPIEITDVNLSFINDPLPTVLIAGSANSTVAGQLRVKGTYQRGNQDLVLNIKARGLPLRTALLQRFPFACPNNALADLILEAKADVDARVAYRPKAKEPADYKVRLALTEGKLQHPQILLPLSDVKVVLEITNGAVTLEDFHARSGSAVLKGRASGQLPCLDQFFDAQLEVAHLSVDAELIPKLPEKVRFLQQTYQAIGTTNLKVTCSRRGSKWVTHPSGTDSSLVLTPENVNMCFVKFPYPLEKVTGQIEWNMQSTRTQVELVGYNRDRPVQFRGHWQGHGTDVDASFDIQATNVTIDNALIAALPAKPQKLTNSFHPKGMVDVKAHLRRRPGSALFHNEYHIGLTNGAVCWDEFPYPLEKVSGFLDIYPTHWEFREGRGSFQGCEVIVQGKSMHRDKTAKGPEEGMFLTITGRNLGLNEHLHKALAPLPALVRAWDSFHPQGRLNFTANIERHPDEPNDMDVLVDVRGCSFQPVFLPYLLHDLSGQFRFHNNRLEITKVRAKHENVEVEMDQGTVDVRPGGAHFTDLRDLRVRNLQVDPTFVHALPGVVQSALTSLDLKGPVSAQTRLVISQSAEPGAAPEVWWDGQLLLDRARLTTGIEWTNVSGVLACTGRHNGRQLQGLTGNLLLDQADLFKQPFKKMHGKFHVKDGSPEIFNLAVHAPIYGGDVTGQMRVEFTSAMRYELNLTASHVDLKDFGVHNLGPSSQLSGIAVGRLHLTGMGANINTLDGNGSIDVPNGRLYNLPLLLDLLKFLGLRWPDRTAFEELHALFSIEGPKVNMRRLELLGNAISLSGKGDFKLDGTDMNLDFYPTWARVEQVLPASVRAIPPVISRNLLTIEMRGKVGARPEDLKFNKKIVPLLMDPLQSVRDRVIGPAPMGN